MIDSLMTAQDVRKVLKCSLPYVYNLASRGQIPCVRFPCPSKSAPRDTVRFKAEDVRAFIDKYYMEVAL